MFLRHVSDIGCLFRNASNFLRVSLAMVSGRKPKFDKECMGYYASGNNTDARQRAFWAGYNRSKTKNHYTAGVLAGKISVLWGILRCVQILIMVVAMAIILRGCDVLVTLQQLQSSTSV